MNRISSSLTFLYKYAFFILWSGVFGFASITDLIHGKEDKWETVLVWILGSLFIYLISGRNKVVDFDGENFHVSNFIRSETIHKSNVIAVSSSILLFPEVVWLNLNKESSFGKRVFFMPEYRFWGSFSHHPIANEIADACNLQ